MSARRARLVLALLVTVLCVSAAPAYAAKSYRAEQFDVRLERTARRLRAGHRDHPLCVRA